MNRGTGRSFILTLILSTTLLLSLLIASPSWAAIYFTDDMEGAGTWTAQSPWAQTTADFHGGAKAWTDSPDAYYGNLKDLSLSQSASVSLAGATNPQLVFWHKYQIEQDFDFGHVEISMDGGANWPTRLASFSGISGWKREQIDLTDYAGETDIRIRFRLVTDKTVVQDGWTIDDMVIAEPPVAVAALTISNPTASSLDLSWTENLDTDFASYKIYRSTSASVTTASTLVTTITAKPQTTYTDSGLVPGTTYYYRIYVVNTRDLYAGSREESDATVVSAYSFPFFDNMEHGAGGWTAAAPWGLTGTDKHSGSYCWTDSPGGSYGPAIDKSLEIKIDMGTAIMPVLTFWHRYTFDPNSDFGYLEVKEDGATVWSRLYFVTGTLAAWTEERVDLSSYAGKKIALRFRVVSDSNGIQSDGWYIDDVRVDETMSAVLPYPFRDDMEATATALNWHSSSWALVADSHGGTYAFTDSPEGNYGELTASELAMASSIDLTTAVHPQLSFWHKYTFTKITSGSYCSYTTEYDYGRVYLSTYNGQSGTWTEIASFNGSSAWVQEKIDLSSWAGLPNVRIKFVINDNKSANGNCNTRSAGWTVDDVIIENAPVDVSLSITSSSMHEVQLAWTQNSDSDFDRYEIYRSSTPTVTRNSTLVASIAGQATLSYIDPVAMVQPGSYYYRIWVVDRDGNLSLGSNNVHATYTVPVNAYPFSDDAEAMSGKWSYGSPWGLAALPASESHANVASSVWTDSPGANYGANADSSISMFINLGNATTPVLSFWQKHSLEEGKDFIRLEVSEDSGQTWTTLRAFTGTETAWSYERVNLTPYAGQSALGLRFHLTSDGANQQDGWYMDDLTIQEETIQASYPFTDDMESGATPWFYTSPWGRTTTDKHSGSYSWTDSPGGSYAAGADTSLQVAIDLGSADMPVLSFWQKYAFDVNSDFGYVEVREGGSTNWQRIFFVTGTQASWKESRVDLSRFAGKQVDLRFRVVADTNGIQSDGWYIDDLRIGETQSAALTYPFYDDVDGTAAATNWHRSSWGFGTDKHSGSYAFTDSIEGDYGARTESELILANILNLTGAAHPQLTFWHKYDFTKITSGSYCSYTTEYDYGIVYLSTYNGQAGTWRELTRYNGTQATWERQQIDLSQWAGLPNVRIKFVINDNNSANNNCNTRRTGWTIDDIVVEDAPVDVALSITNSSMNSVTLAWTANGNSDFDHYEIYRSSSPGVSRGNTLVATIPSIGTTTLTDNVALVQPGTYYYRLWVFDTDGNVSMGSNEVRATYTIPANTYPFSEDGEGGTAQWARGTPWGLTDENPHSGSYAWTDSPGANYDANANTTLSTYLNLSGSTYPVLTFWHRYSLEDGKDFVKLEISTDGGQNWTILKSFTGTETAWNQERVNLTPYAGNANLGLRFRLTADGANQQDGWYMDDLQIKEEATTAPYPFMDDMEHGAIPWFYDSPWGLVTLSPSESHTGAASTVWSDSPAGSYLPGTDSSLNLTVDLGSANMPLLSFWQRYAFESNSDFGYLEVKEVGATSWNRLYFATGTSASWVKSRVDLSGYGGKQVNLRFRVITDSNGTQSDGWYIDDIQIAETPAAPLPYPFASDMDDAATATSWIPSNWSLVSGGHSGTYAFTDSALGNYAEHVNAELILANTIDLRGTLHPQLSFWHKYDFTKITTGSYCSYSTEYDYGKVHLSTYNGRPGTWTEVGSFNGTQSTWLQEKIDLSAWAGLPNVRIKFVINDRNSGNNNCNTRKEGWTIDDVRIGEDETIPSIIQKTAGDNQTGLTGTALTQPFTAKVYDSDSRPRSGIVVDFAVTSGGGTLSQPSATSDASGTVSTLLTLGSASGTNTVTATINGTTQSVLFSATGYTAGQAKQLAKISGDNQFNAVNLALSNPLVVQVTDILGNAVEGTEVSFTKISGGGTLGITTPVATNSAGLASNTLLLGAGTGTTTISAGAPGLTGSPVTFTAYAILSGGTLGDTDGDGIPDAWETTHSLNPNDKDDAALDPDGDGLTNLEEYTRGTDPNKADTDNDGMPDGWEVRYGFDPLDASDAAKDANRDGVTNLQHYQADTVPVLAKHFTIAGGTSESMAIYGAATIDGIPLREGDEVAVLDPQGVVCGQYTVTTPGQYGFMHVYKDDPATPADEGAQLDDILTFRIWNAVEKVELDVVTEVITGTRPPRWTGDGNLAQINLTGSGKYSIPLHTGWNLISFPIKTCYYADGVAGYADGAPTEPMLPGTVYQKVTGISDVFSSISGLYDVVRSFDANGAHTFDPALPGFSDMKYIAGGYGYWIKMKSPGYLEVNGVKASAGDALSLHPGWNLVGYWHPQVKYTGATPAVDFPAGVTQFTAVANIDTVLTAISGNYWVVRTFDGNGAHTFDPLLGTFNDLHYLGPGYGMWIKMKTVDQLSY